MLIAVALLVASGWEVGVAKRSITPQQALWMAGYASRTGPATGTESELNAHVFALRDGGKTRAVAVALDLVGIDAGLTARVKKRLFDRHGLSEAEVVLACSHTHCGPVVGSTLRSMYPLDDGLRERSRAYADYLIDQIDAATKEALGRWTPCSLSWHMGECGFAVNRRANKEAEVPAIKAAGKPLAGPVDHRVPVLAARSTDGRMLGLLFGYACHATTLSFDRWCADYPGFASTSLEGLYPGATCLFLAGCGADQNPLPRRTVALAKGYGEELAQSVAKAVAKPGLAMPKGLAVSLKSVGLPLAAAPTAADLEQQASGKDKYLASRARTLLADLKTGQPLRTDYPFPVQAWRIGNLNLVFLGGEVVVDYSLRLAKEIPEPAWVASYCNDVMAYIPSQRVLKEGGYEGATSMIYYGLPASWREDVERILVGSVLERVRQLNQSLAGQ
ncbi:MAG: neutral/alkaline non-lysosomal ceramidase N-terminal domain-containing protein [Gemmataceae bacterium]